jgi:polyphosphate kinase
LAEAENPENPLLERGKFLAIFESNLDEFVMVRVSGLIEQAEAGSATLTPDGMTPHQQLEAIDRKARPLRDRAARVWARQLRPELAKAGIKILRWSELTKATQVRMSSEHRATIVSVCVPLMIALPKTFPFISNRSLNLIVELESKGERRLARVKVPTVIPALYPVAGKQGQYVMTEDLVRAHLDHLFPGYEIIGSWLFRVVRDAEVEIKELEASDLISMVEETVRKRRFGAPIFLEVEQGISDFARKSLMEGLELEEGDVYMSPNRVGYEFLWEVSRLPRPDLRFSPFTPYQPRELARTEPLFERIRRGDVLVHHPFDSFDLVERFVASAATDPKVIGIRMTLYRVGSPSPIVQSLMAAAEAGKQVAVMVELKARFDESNNLEWSRALEDAGAHVSFGVPELKVHSKLCLVVREEDDGIRSYAHVGTGNYNPFTARLYTDLGLFTCHPDVTADVTEMFNFLTGYSHQSEYRRLLVAPFSLRESIISRVHREIESTRQTGRGRIIFKLNSLVDPEVIDALYEASQAGVEVDLVVRGICCLRPGVAGLSENIRLRSVVGRFLEHSRVYWFSNGGVPEALIGSADMMRRNLDRRTEVLVPLTDPAQIDYLLTHVLESALRDDKKGWTAGPAGKYARLERSDSPFSSQEYLLDHSALRMLG